MAGVAQHLGVVDFQSPIGADVEWDDVIDDGRGGEQAFEEARLAEAAVQLAAVLGYSFPIAVVTALGGRAALAVVEPAGQSYVLVAVPGTGGVGATSEAAPFL
jgi:hypothetical protein